MTIESKVISKNRFIKIEDFRYVDEMLIARAPAKINLFLHIIGRQDNGYHILESLMVFLSLRDEVIMSPADKLSIEFVGEHNIGIDSGHNTVLSVIQIFERFTGIMPKVSLIVKKNIPSCSGTGGGSADAAAVLKMLSVFYNIHLSEDTMKEIALEVGTDVVACLDSKTCLVEGIGDRVSLAEVPSLKKIPILLVNPRIPLSAPEVYKGFRDQEVEFNNSVNDISMDKIIHEYKNDLQPISEMIVPSVKLVCDEMLAQEGCMISRMTGSGSTCFSFFSSMEEVELAQNNIKEKYPEWWSKVVFVN